MYLHIFEKHCFAGWCCIVLQQKEPSVLALQPFHAVLMSFWTLPLSLIWVKLKRCWILHFPLCNSVVSFIRQYLLGNWTCVYSVQSLILRVPLWCRDSVKKMCSFQVKHPNNAANIMIFFTHLIKLLQKRHYTTEQYSKLFSWSVKSSLTFQVTCSSKLSVWRLCVTVSRNAWK